MTNKNLNYNMTAEDIEDKEFEYEKKHSEYSAWVAKERIIKNIRETRFVNFKRKLTIEEMKKLVRLYKLNYDKNVLEHYKKDFGDYVTICYDYENHRLYVVSIGARLYGMVRGMKSEAGKKNSRTYN